MIARVWHGAVPEAKADAYQAYLLKTGLPDYRATEGNQGVWMFRRASEGNVHFVLTSFWESYDAIRKFAGEDFEKSRYYPEDEAYLIELEPYVYHYEVIDKD